MLVLEINQGPLLGKGFLFERNGTGHFAAFSRTSLFAPPASVSQSSLDKAWRLWGSCEEPRPALARQLLFEPSSDRKIKSGSEGSGKHGAMSLLKAADASFGVTCCG